LAMIRPRMIIASNMTPSKVGGSSFPDDVFSP
jgi:hypothetical protein